MLDASHAQLSTYCTAQGRMLATLLLWHDAPDYLLQLPAEIAGRRARAAAEVHPARRRHARRRDPARSGSSAWAARVRRPPSPDWSILPPAAPMAIARGQEVTVIRVHEQELFEIVVPASALERCLEPSDRHGAPRRDGWMALATDPSRNPRGDRCHPGAVCAANGQPRATGGSQLHQRLLSRAGDRCARPVPWRGQAPAVPPARDPTPNPQPGSRYSSPASTRACGTVLDAAPAPGGGFDLLAVVSISAAEAGDLRLGGADGPVLRVCP